MIKLLFLMAIIAHWIACFWHLLFKLDPHEARWTFDMVGSNSAEVNTFDTVQAAPRGRSTSRPAAKRHRRVAFRLSQVTFYLVAYLNTLFLMVSASAVSRITARQAPAAQRAYKKGHSLNAHVRRWATTSTPATRPSGSSAPLCWCWEPASTVSRRPCSTQQGGALPSCLQTGSALG